MVELTQQAFDRIAEMAKNAIKERDVAREALKRIHDKYDAYRAKGVGPAPVQYQGVVDAINQSREAIVFNAEESGQ